MELPNTGHPHLEALGLGLRASFKRNVSRSEALSIAVADLLVELQLEQAKNDER